MQPTMLTYIKETPAQLAYNNEHSKEITKQLDHFHLNDDHDKQNY